MDPRARCWGEMCFKEEEKEEDEDEEIIPKTRNIDSTFLRWQISLSLFQHDLLKSADHRNLVVIVSPTHPLVDPRYTTSAVVKGRWCAEAVPPRTKKDSQYIAQQRHQKPQPAANTNGYCTGTVFRFSVSLHSLGSSLTITVQLTQSHFR